MHKYRLDKGIKRRMIELIIVSFGQNAFAEQSIGISKMANIAPGIMLPTIALGI